jgi:uncharacterized membrane protein YedE/YeeE
MDWLYAPWPWYVVGPLLGLFPAVLLVVGNRLFGVSSNLRHMCAAAIPCGLAYFTYDWRRDGAWNLLFALGILSGGFLAGFVFRNPDVIAISDATHRALEGLGIRDFSGLAPAEIFNWSIFGSVRGWLLIVGGGFLVGFGTAYAGGCTSGHGLSGIADLQPASALALVAFFAGGIFATFVLVPLLLGAAG